MALRDCCFKAQCSLFVPVLLIVWLAVLSSTWKSPPCAPASCPAAECSLPIETKHWEVTGERLSRLVSARYETLISAFSVPPTISSNDLEKRWSIVQRSRTRTNCTIRVAMCVPTKNDAFYLQEWAAYHLSIGVTHIYLYDHNSSIHPSVVLQPFMDLGFVTVLPNQGGSQSSVYQDCLSRFKNKYHWVFAGDSDEYIVPENPNQCFGELLENNFATKLAVQLQWATFYTSGYDFYDPNRLVIERYTRRAQYATGSKAVYRSNRINPRIVGIHSTGVEGNVSDESIPVNIYGSPMPKMKKGGPYGFFEEKRPNYTSVLYINHYWSKSFEEFVLKRARGRFKKQKNSYELESLARFESQSSLEDLRIQMYLNDVKFLLGITEALR